MPVKMSKCYISEEWWSQRTTQGLSEMSYWDIYTVFKFYSTVGWPQGRITHQNLKKNLISYPESATVRASHSSEI